MTIDAGRFAEAAMWETLGRIAGRLGVDATDAELLRLSAYGFPCRAGYAKCAEVGATKRRGAAAATARLPASATHAE